MSGYPSPYSPPGWQDQSPYAVGQSDFAAPARRAGNALIILGGLLIILGVCAGICSSVDMSKLPDPKTRENYEKIDSQIRQNYGIGFSEFLRDSAIRTLIAAVVSIGIGLGARTGRRLGIIIAIIFVGLLLLVSARGLFISPNICNLAVIAAFLVLLGFIMRWLFQAIHSERSAQSAQAQYQWQLQQYQQQMAAYTQAQQAASISVARVDHAAIDVFDVPRAKAFYGDVLGLTEVPRPASFDFGGAWYRIGQVDLHLVQREKPEGGGGRHICFWIGDLRGLAQRIEAAGTKIDWENRYKITGVERFFVRDPDGNRLEFQGSDGSGTDRWQQTN